VIVCLVTDRRRRDVLEHGRDAARAGVDLIQLREPGLDARALSTLAGGLVRVTRSAGTRIVVNDRADVALASRADGVHLRASSILPGEVRSIARAGFLVGRSVHSVDEAVRVAPDVDYLIAGTVFPTPSKPGQREHLGLDGLAAVARAVTVPVLAIGGVSMDRIEAVAAAGAAGVAAIGLFDARDEQLLAIVAEARRRFDSARSPS